MEPRITLILFCFNQVAFIEEAARACLAQECEPIEILFSDDASTDGSFEILRSIVDSYQGPHRLRLRRNANNLGIGAHYNEAINESRGRLLITAAGDDISLPHRVRRLAERWDRSGECLDLIASDVIDMDLTGKDQGLLKVSDLSGWTRPEHWTRKRPYVIGASHAFSKRMHERFGPFRSGLQYEDQVMAFRASCLGGAATVPEALLRYRRGGLSSRTPGQSQIASALENLSLRNLRQAALFSQIRQDLDTIQRADLWKGKVARYLSRSETALDLVHEKQARRWRNAFDAATANGWLWTLRLVTKVYWAEKTGLNVQRSAM